VARVDKSADEIKIVIFFKNPSEQKENKRPAKLTDNFAGIVTSDTRPDVVREPSVGQS
jgi:hypothetical protein